MSLHGSPRAWVYGLGQDWSLQIQFLSLAQSLSVAFLSKRLHLAALVQKISHFRIVVSKVLTIFSSDLNCISKLLRQYCLTDFNDWNNYSNFLFYVILFFWYIRDKRYSFMSCICILIFCYSAPSIPKYWYYSVLG